MLKYVQIKAEDDSKVMMMISEVMNMKKRRKRTMHQGRNRQYSVREE